MSQSPHAQTRPDPAPADGGDGGVSRFGAIVDLLLTVGYVDGVFHPREQAYVRKYLDSALALIAYAGAGTAAERAQLRDTWRAHFDGLYARLQGEIAAAASAPGGGRALAGRALATFAGLAAADQAVALEVVQALMRADGVVTPPEQALYDELSAHLGEATVTGPPPTTTPPPPPAPAPPKPAGPPAAARTAGPAAATVRVAPAAPMIVGPPRWYPLESVSHPLLDPLERTYSPHPVERQAQVAWDYQVVQHAIAQWNRQRADGTGLLAGVTDVEQFPPGTRFLDDFVHVFRPGQPAELIVLGDLHGCYSCLKAALLQSNFIQRVWAHQWDPATYPDVKLVLLGDYIDRGRFSFDGVLRAVLQLLVALPDNVFVLRGNHEYFVWLEGEMHSGVHPAEALASLTPNVPPEMLEAYRLLFEHMPTSLLVDRTLFVHGGIPREDTFAAWRDLSSLNDPSVRFQMMWSDPTATDQVPVDVQRRNPRFPFGRQQFRAFMEKVGMHTMIRGHEQIDRGFETVYDLGDRVLLSLFSAGGLDNADLPPGAPYRRVTPMALTIDVGDGPPRATPWPIHYQPFNHEPYNGLYRPQPLLEFRYA